MPQALAKEADIARSKEALMRKSLVGDALWRSDKLNQIGLPSYRAEYANLQFNRGCCCGCGQKQWSKNAGNARSCIRQFSLKKGIAV